MVTADSSLVALIDTELHARGWKVVVAAGASVAETILADEPLSLVVVDTEIKGAVPLCGLVRTVPSTSEIRLLIVTPPQADDLAALLNCGADDVLTRPSHAADSPRRLLAARRLALVAGEAERATLERNLEQARSSLGVQTAFFEQLFESAPEGVAVVDSEDRIVRANGEFCRMFGFDLREIMERSINDLIAPSPHVRDAREVTKKVHSGQVVALETTRYRKDGTPLEVSLLAKPIRLEGSQARGALAIYRDITERRRVQQALRESEQRYRTLFDQSPLGILQFDRDLHVSACNPRLSEAVSYAAERLIGLDLGSLQDARLISAIRQALDGEFTLYEGHCCTPLAEPGFWMAAHMSPLHDAEGQVIGGMAVIEDITRRKEAESRLQKQTREMEQINETLQERTRQVETALQARNRLYAAMNHELRTPISAIMLYNDLLLSGAMGPLSTPQSEGVDHAQNAARHLLELVQDVLDLSKLEAGKMSITSEPVSLPALIRELLPTVQPLAAGRGSEIRVELPSEDLVLRTDAKRVRQILLNLLSNAVKFGDGKPIHLRCIPSPNAGASLTVRDEGCGIAAEDHARIFDDFVQVGEQQDAGTGLGLPLSRRLAELLGGTIDVQSAPGVGSSFRLVLPIQNPAVPRRISESAHNE